MGIILAARVVGLPSCAHAPFTYFLFYNAISVYSSCPLRPGSLYYSALQHMVSPTTDVLRPDRHHAAGYLHGKRQ
jgi:hypothetical protein